MGGTLDKPLQPAVIFKRKIRGLAIGFTAGLLLISSIKTTAPREETAIYSEAESTSIIYIANGEDVRGIPAETTFTGSEIATTSPTIPVRYGYAFQGWSTDPNAVISDSDFSPGQAYFGDNLVLYAVWEELEIAPMMEDNTEDNIIDESEKVFTFTQKK